MEANADHADDIAIQANTSNQAETLQHCLENEYNECINWMNKNPINKFIFMLFLEIEWKVSWKTEIAKYV